MKIFVWVGQFSPPCEREFAIQSKLLKALSLPVEVIEQGNEPAMFWMVMPGSRQPYPYESLRIAPKARLFHCSIGTGTFGISEVVDYCQDDLSTHDVYIVDAIAEVFVWFGRRSAEKERRWAMEAATEYLDSSPIKRGDQLAPIYRVLESEEPYRFTTHFHAWMNKKTKEQSNGLSGGLEDVRSILTQFSRTYTYEELKNNQFSKALDTSNIEVSYSFRPKWNLTVN